jgi:hypothetical protein
MNQIEAWELGVSLAWRRRIFTVQTVVRQVLWAARLARAAFKVRVLDSELCPL